MLDQVLDPIQRFISWTNRKIQIHFDNRPEFYFYEREIWWASLGENIGSETNGKNYHFERPVIIIKKFSKDMLFVIPTTSKPKAGSWYYPIECATIKTQAIMAQAKTISAKRLIRKVDNVDAGQFNTLLEAFVGLIKANPPA